MSIQNLAWVRLSKPGKDTLRIFFFPFSGATALVFRPFAALLPQGIGAYAYELPARGGRFQDKAFETIKDMAQEAANSIESLLMEKTFFFGHSLGGIIAFETIRELRHRSSVLPKHLFVSGVRAPQTPHREKNCHDLPKDAFITKIQEFGGTPKEILDQPELMEIFVPILRKDFQAYETYQCQPEAPLPIPITAMGGKSDGMVTSQDIAAWSRQTDSAFFSQMFEGDHFFLTSNTGPIVESIKNKIFARQNPW